MTGATGWMVFVPIVVGLIAVALLLWQGAHIERGFYVEERSLRCPKLHRDVVATMVRSSPLGVILGVRCCTGLPDPELVTCGRECLAELQEAATMSAGFSPPAQVLR